MAHIALTAYELESGGISRVAVHLANGFSAHGHRVSLALCTSRGAKHAKLRELLSDDVDVVAFSASGYPRRFIGLIATLAAYRRYLRAERPDIVLGTSNNIAWFTAAGLVRLEGAKPALFVKTTNPVVREQRRASLPAIHHFGYDRTFGLAEAVLTLSEAESQLLRSEFPDDTGKFRSVYNPYLTPSFLANSAINRDERDGPTIVAIGRLDTQKNIARAIRAFAIVRARNTGMGAVNLDKARLVVAGDGPHRAELKTLAHSLGVADAVDFPGFCDDIPVLLRSADRFLLSSNYEGLPAVVIEALGCGVPVVSTDCFVAARELLADLPGCQVTDLSAEALADGLLASMAVSLPDGERLRNRVLDYSLEPAVASHLEAMRLAPAQQAPCD